MALLRSYLVMMPRLMAEQQASDLRVALAAGALRIEPQDARAWMDEIDLMVGGAVAIETRQPATPEALAAIGIHVVTEDA